MTGRPRAIGTGGRSRRRGQNRAGRASGAYQLLIYVGRTCHLRVGRLGRGEVARGWYVYSGSARGGLGARVARHLRRHKKRHWHIDYLLARPEVRVAAVRFRTGPDAHECSLHQALACRGGRPVWPGFGSSDCRRGCRSHLVRLEGGPEPGLGWLRLEDRGRPL